MQHASVPDRIWSAVLEYRWAMLAAFSAALAVYGPDIFYSSVGIDEEDYLVVNAPALFLGHNRWGIFLLKTFLLPTGFSPFFSTLLAILLLCCAAAVMSASLRLAAGERTFFCTLYVLFPQFAYQIYFGHQSDCLSFGLLSAATAFYAFQRFADGGRLPYLALSIGALAFATGVYQSLIFCPPVLYMADMLRRLLSRETFSARAEIRRFFLFLAVCFAAICLYSLLGRFFTQLLSISTENYLFVHFMGWLSLSPWAVLKTCVKGIAAHMAGLDYYGEVLFLAVHAFTAVILLSQWRALSPSGKAWLIILLPGLLLAPFLQILCLGNNLPPRTLLGQGICFAALGTFALFRPARHKLLVAAVAVFCTLAAAAHTSQLFFMDSLRWEADKLLASRIIERIYTVDPAFSVSDTRVYIHGAPNIELPRPRSRHTDIFGTSIFAHDGGHVYRTRAIMKICGLGSLWVPSREEILQLQDAVKNMPLWPRGGSVAMVNGIMVVKLGPEPGYIGP